MAQSGKRILIINSSYPPVPGGVSDYTAKLAQSLAEHNAVRILTSRQFKIHKQPGNPSVLPFFTRWHRKELLRLIPALLCFRPHLVVVQYPTEIPASDPSLTPWVPVVAKIVWPWSKRLYIIHEY